MYSADIVGIELIADLKDCNSSRLTELNMLEVQLQIRLILQKYNLTELNSIYHNFGPGFTGLVLLSESHIAMHTWPEKNYVSVNIYLCNHARDNTRFIREILNEVLTIFQPGHTRVTEIVRSPNFD